LLQSLVGPPVKGVADLGKSDKRLKAESQKDPKKAGSDSFGDVLGTKENEAPPPDRVEIQRGDPDKTAEKLKATNDTTVEKKTKGSSQRQQAILKFMDSFESEFGVPPTKIVEAMANLDSAQQAESPEETADQVIGQLDLEDSKSDQAKNMYIGLLAQLAQIEKTPALPPKPEQLQPKVTGTTGDRFAATQQKTLALNHSLEHMNEKFWMKGTEGAPVAAPQGDLADKMAQMSLQEKLGSSSGLSSLNVDENSFARDLKAQMPVQGDLLKPPQGQEVEVTSTPEGALAALVAAARAAKGTAEAKDLGDDSAASGLDGADDAAVGAAAVKPEVPNAHGKNLDVAAPAQSQQKGAESFQQQQQGFGQQSGMKNAKGEMLEKSKLSEKAEFKSVLGADGAPQAQALPPLKHDFSMTANEAAAAVPGIPAPSTEHEANIRQIMNQAQYLIKKGGGEMNVQMSPEGMGQIHMKVLVENGRVNVQMAAQTDEAKKTLESGLSDLKNSLAAHKLSMDHVKIDVVNSTNTENNTQSQMNDPGGREQTRQFWNKFTDNFGSPSQQRESFTDIPSMKGYAKKRTDSALEPIGPSSVRSYAASGKGSGLNLVA
jgi:flagellar hook-length control protein FliK